MTVTLEFHGAAGTVTGSCYRVVHPHGQFLVDCGMFQGNRTVRDLNYKPTPFDPHRIDFVLLTHAHIDHCGLLPKLYHNGFAGPMWMTPPTSGLLEYLLLDAAGIQESETEQENRKLARKNEPLLQPLYTIEDAQETLKHREMVDYQTWITPGPGVRARYWNAGHILGSASIEVEVADNDGSTVTLLFSGDIGPDEKVFYKDPEAPAGFDYILCESTYGGRERDDYTLAQRREALKNEINEALGRGGNLVIPAFAVERSQELLHDIGLLIKEGSINPSLVFLDSPLASKVTAVYKKYASMFAETDLTADELFNDPRFRIVESVEESKAINSIRGGAIILSASGMADAGRIKHHLRNNLPRANATVLFVGYQAPGTLGQIIQSGAREVRIHGEEVPVRARVRSLGNYSAHADHSELMAWIRERLPAHGAIFLTHGEDEERAALRAALVTSGIGGDQVVMPMLDDAFELRASGVASVSRPEVQRIDPAQLAVDWHMAYAQFLIQLGDVIKGADSDTRRLAVMTSLQRQLNALNAPVTTPVMPAVTETVHAEPSGE
ncbi:MBL fold metallo-hydrolase RNA specificity domain-containing protein [Paradevosia shaoguanensis]|uniref:MBL fold metallo-hydrolase n=1 Tax=Paradevosia shaoguanensis TaxID=1335043 RepID=A0AA41QR79_9HYPH|nr:MBL fold metallo-hydrolase [Paradevosia shaoguanensis]MCF1744031.1 MBL fold metallo-hydrolase [Paradevosia shaoguanensis]MCI0128514.1 MBL fold metallo-hydrolase [Paradevosia shaoguanensis]